MARRRKDSRAEDYKDPAFLANMERIAGNLQRLRKKREWTIEDAAFHCRLASSQVQGLEKGWGSPTVLTLGKLCKGFGVDLSELTRKPRRKKKRSSSPPRVYRRFPRAKRQSPEGALQVLLCGLRLRRGHSRSSCRVELVSWRAGRALLRGEVGVTQ
jgi:transcriptional regulator with XRE-family HTH domain